MYKIVHCRWFLDPLINSKWYHCALYYCSEWFFILILYSNVSIWFWVTVLQFCSIGLIYVIVKDPWECLSETQLFFDRSLIVFIICCISIWFCFIALQGDRMITQRGFRHKCIFCFFQGEQLWEGIVDIIIELCFFLQGDKLCEEIFS